MQHLRGHRSKGAEHTHPSVDTASERTTAKHAMVTPITNMFAQIKCGVCPHQEYITQIWTRKHARIHMFTSTYPSKHSVAGGSSVEQGGLAANQEPMVESVQEHTTRGDSAQVYVSLSDSIITHQS